MSTEKATIMNFVLAGAEAMLNIQKGMIYQVQIDLQNLSSELETDDCNYLVMRLKELQGDPK